MKGRKLRRRNQWAADRKLYRQLKRGEWPNPPSWLPAWFIERLPFALTDETGKIEAVRITEIWT